MAKSKTEVDPFEREKAADLITKAINFLMLSNKPDYAFYSSILMTVPITEKTEGNPTSCTDGVQIWYNPRFVSKLTKHETAALLIHECLHIAFKDPLLLMEGKEHNIANLAADMANDQIIVLDCKLPMPNVGKPNDKGEGHYEPKYKDWAKEEIYRDLEKNATKIKIVCKGHGHGSQEEQDQEQGSGQDEKDDPNTITVPCSGCLKKPDKHPSELSADIDTMVSRAIIASKSKGSLPGGLSRLIDESRETKVNLRDVLPVFLMRSICKDDYSWKRPNRRLIHAGLFAPSLRSEAFGHVGFAADTSASMGEAEMNETVAALNGVGVQVKPEKVTFLSCDADVHKVEVFERHDFPIAPKFVPLVGGGGTDFRPVFTYFQKNEQPDCLIYVTDGYGTFPDVAPSYPVLWILTAGKVEVPFGMVCHV